MPPNVKRRTRNSTEKMKSRAVPQDHTSITTAKRIKKAVSGRVMTTAIADKAKAARKKGGNSTTRMTSRVGSYGGIGAGIAEGFLRRRHRGTI